jgi:hypothetical protein
MPLWVLLGFGFLFIFGESTAGICTERYNLVQGCHCDDEVKGLSIPSPSSFSLYAICHLSDVDGHSISLSAAHRLAPELFDMGKYYYRGSRTFTGRIVKVDDLALGDTVKFYPDHHSASVKANQRQSRLQDFSHLKSIYLSDETKIGTTSLVVSGKISWCAQATITLKEIATSIADTEGEGPLATRYEVVHRGNFRKC